MIHQLIQFDQNLLKPSKRSFDLWCIIFSRFLFLGVLEIMSKLETKKQESNFVYIIRLFCQRKYYQEFGGKINLKVGVSNDPARRLYNLESDGCPFIKLELSFWVRFESEYIAKEAEKSMHLKYQKNNIKGEWFWFGSKWGMPPTFIKKHLFRFPGAVEMSEHLPKYTEIRGDRYFIKETIRAHNFHKQKKTKCAICNKEFIKGSWQAKYCSSKCRKVARDKYFNLQKQLKTGDKKNAKRKKS